MSKIELHSESGKWKYKTRTDDPLFAPILGAMVEEGMKLPNKLVIPGSLGEALEREWKYIDVLRKWTEWDASCTVLTPEDYSEVVNMKTRYISVVQHNPPANIVVPAARRGNQEAILRARIARALGIVQPQQAPPVTDGTWLSLRLPAPPSKVLWRHEFPVLSTALSLPDGWETVVAVDERSSLADRILHMNGALNFFRRNPRNSFRNVWYLGEHTQDLYDSSMDPEEGEISILAPFIRNLWLREQAGTVTIPPIISQSGLAMGNITIASILAYLDWDVVRNIIVHDARTLMELSDITNVMTGNRNNTPGEESYGMIIKKNMEALFTSLPLSITKGAMLDTLALEHIYSRLVAHLPDNASIELMGLEPILGIREVSSWATITNTSATSITDIVGTVNAGILTYLKWYDRQLQEDNEDPTLPNRINTPQRISREEFPQIVQLLAESIGLYAMRRILLSLLVHVSDRQSKNKYKQEVERASLFATLLEEYLEEHNGEDEGMRTLYLSKTAVVEKLKHYYD